MGYSTDFYGQIEIEPRIKPEHKAYINKFSATRRMARDEGKVASLSDPVRTAAGLPVGHGGGFFVGATGHAGQDRDNSVKDFNLPPAGQPSLWCQWVVEDDALMWDGGEKFYDYVEWMKYMVDNFFKPWGYTLNGEIEWQGEERDDRGMIIVKDNVVTVKKGRVVYGDEAR